MEFCDWSGCSFGDIDYSDIFLWLYNKVANPINGLQWYLLYTFVHIGVTIVHQACKHPDQAGLKEISSWRDTILWKYQKCRSVDWKFRAHSYNHIRYHWAIWSNRFYHSGKIHTSIQRHGYSKNRICPCRNVSEFWNCITVWFNGNKITDGQFSREIQCAYH